MSPQTRIEYKWLRRNRRWFVLPLPLVTGLFFVLICFWTLQAAYAGAEEGVEVMRTNSALTPPAQIADENFEYEVKYTSRNARHTRSVAWGDVDGDGHLDLALSRISLVNGAAIDEKKIAVKNGVVISTSPAIVLLGNYSLSVYSNPYTFPLTLSRILDNIKMYIQPPDSGDQGN